MGHMAWHDSRHSAASTERSHGWRRLRAHETDVQSVTTAGMPRSADLTRRQIQYAVAMTIRLICFILAVAVPFGPLTWLFIVAATVLPYVAVVLANATSGQPSRGSLVSPTRELPSLSDPVVYRVPPTRDERK